MTTVTIQRDATGDDGTFGTLLVLVDGAALRCHTLEPPDRGNARGRSSIPAGRYRCRWARTHSKGTRYVLDGVPGRSGILIHAGNWAGDVEKKRRSDSEGCILLGMGRGVISNQAGITASLRAVAAFEAMMAGEPFDLVIQDAV